MRARPPVILGGCHRSGTSLVTGMLRQLGLWTGSHLDPNGESVFFLRRNEWILRRAGGAWDHPLPTMDFLADPRFLGDVVRRLSREVRSRRFHDYAGRAGLLRGPRATRLVGPWGWKDPRNVFTLPAWERVFPGARRLLVLRHGVAAAASLWAREQTRWHDQRDGRYLDMRPLPRRLLEAGRTWERLDAYLISTRCRSLEAAFGLWEEYAQAIARMLEQAGPETLVVRFEDLLTDPGPVLLRAARFCGLDPTEAAVAAACTGLHPDRAHAWERDEGLAAFQARVGRSPWLVALGYGAPRPVRA